MVQTRRRQGSSDIDRTEKQLNLTPQYCGVLSTGTYQQKEPAVLEHVVPVTVHGLKIMKVFDRKEIARATIYFLKNDLHTQPFGYLEDVFVEDAFRRQGLAKELVAKIIALAREHGCYKIVATSRRARLDVHKLYESFGFVDRGREFRLDLKLAATS